MKFNVKRTGWSYFNSETDKEEYVIDFEIHNDSERAAETIAVIVQSGVMPNVESVKEVNHRTHGGSLRFLPDQTTDQVTRRRHTHIKHGHTQEQVQSSVSMSDAELRDRLEREFGRAKAETYTKGATANLIYMKRTDGSAVMPDEEAPPNAVAARSVEHMHKPLGWGAW